MMEYMMFNMMNMNRIKNGQEPMMMPSMGQNQGQNLRNSQPSYDRLGSSQNYNSGRMPFEQDALSKSDFNRGFYNSLAR